ncbi:MAG TPA: lipoyl synthase [Thermotogota bacterium]|nr:lipoyl synthase [Thermotogota bacterium]
MNVYIKKPEWIRTPIQSNKNTREIKGMIENLNLHTVCKEANCPNLMECFNKRTATFLILGDVCTRNCTFCNIQGGKAPLTVDGDEPANVARMVKETGLKYVVVTSVTRDDLPDGGAQQFVEVIREIKKVSEDIAVEVLIPDFQGDEAALLKVIEAKPNVINHNIETIERLYPDLRPQAEYHRTLELLKRVKGHDSGISTKSGFMLGFDETEEEVLRLMKDLRDHDCEILTIGQYLQPSRKHYPLKKYVHPDMFKKYEETGYEMGFKYVVSGPLVRSSYNAFEAFEAKRQ